MDFGKYVDSYGDLSLYYGGAKESGAFDVANSEYSKKVGGGASESSWVEDMNKRFGTSYNDMSQFTKAQFGQAHYERYGQKEGRKVGTQARSDAKQKAQVQQSTKANTNGQSIFKGNGGAFKDYATGKASLGNMLQDQNVNQDNDITTTITGDNNKVFNEQDNSIRQYGGDNRTFVYNAGKNGDGFSKYEQTPVSAATMAGFYAPDDSPAAQAKFNDLHSTLNRDKQKRYAGDAMKISQKYLTDARNYTDQSMENYLNKSVQYSYDRADRQTAHTFGDIWNKNYISSNWKMPEPPSKITSNASQIAKDAKKDIEDI